MDCERSLYAILDEIREDNKEILRLLRKMVNTTYKSEEYREYKIGDSVIVEDKDYGYRARGKIVKIEKSNIGNGYYFTPDHNKDIVMYFSDTTNFMPVSE